MERHRARHASSLLGGAFMTGLLLLAAMPPLAAGATPPDGPSGISVRVVGDPASGHGTEMLYDGEPLARHRGGGELALRVENTIHNLQDDFIDWKASRVEVAPDGRSVRLDGEARGPRTGIRLGVTVHYEVINLQVLRKTITLEHRYGPRVCYMLANTLEPAAPPASYWTFARWDAAQGGAVREPFPAVGFRTNEGLTVGLLTASGFDNLWTRANTMFDLDPTRGLTSIPREPDRELTVVATAEERARGAHHVEFNFGQLFMDDVVRKDGSRVVEAWNPLLPGQTATKTLVILAEPLADQRALKIACQTRLAEGLGFEGTEQEKLLHANLQMLTWIDEPASMMAYPVPSIGYQFFYQRDAFWMVAATLDATIAQQTWEHVRTTQDDTGGVCCHAIPYRWHAGIPGGETDANVHWVIWAYINMARYGHEPDREALQRNLAWMRERFCIGEPGEYWSRSAGWFDVFALEEPVRFSHMQGEFAIALRCAREMGLRVTDEEIDAATSAYRNSFDTGLGYIPFAQEDPFRVMLSPTSLLPEFMSLWLFGEPILPSEHVHAHLDAIDRTWNKRFAGGFALPNIIRGDGEFQSQENKTFAPSLWWEPGIYHNGGSWLLYEYLAYVAGHIHGWKPAHVGETALERMSRRLELEFSEELEPVSHEYLPLTRAIDTPGSVWDGSSDAGVPGPPGSKVFGWNSFVIIANEVAGLRTPSDPIVLRNQDKLPRRRPALVQGTALAPR